MDSMRAVLMILGVVLHSAQVFNPLQNWLIYSDDTTQIANALVYIIHVFRMPAFFVISGFFCLFTIQKYGSNRFIRLRLIRICVPLVITALLINSLQEFFLAQSNWKIFNFNNYLLEGQWVSHLWFLINLIFYFLCAFIGSLFFAKPLRIVGDYIVRFLIDIPMILTLFIVPLLSITILVLGKIGFPLYAEFYGVLKIYNIATYFPFFLFGILLCLNTDLRMRFTSINPLISLFFIFVAFLLNIYFFSSQDSIERHVNTYLDIVQIWFSISLLFYLFNRFLNINQRLIDFLADASFSIYLFHQVFVVVIGLLLINMGVGGLTGLFILVLTVFFLTVSIHLLLISRFKILRFLFNGK